MNISNKFKPDIVAISFAVLIASAIFIGCQKDTATLVKDSSTSIPSERIGLDGEYDASGLAKRVAQALAEDSVFNTVSTIYVAQNDSRIIFKGTVSDQAMLDRLSNIAQTVSGVSNVDVSQVEVR